MDDLYIFKTCSCHHERYGHSSDLAQLHVPRVRILAGTRVLSAAAPTLEWDSGSIFLRNNIETYFWARLFLGGAVDPDDKCRQLADNASAWSRLYFGAPVSLDYRGFMRYGRQFSYSFVHYLYMLLRVELTNYSMKNTPKSILSLSSIPKDTRRP